MPLARPCSIEREHLKIPVVHVEGRAQCPRDGIRFCAVIGNCRTSCDDIFLRKNRIEKRHGKRKNRVREDKTQRLNILSAGKRCRQSRNARFPLFDGMFLIEKLTSILSFFISHGKRARPRIADAFRRILKRK